MSKKLCVVGHYSLYLVHTLFDLYSFCSNNDDDDDDGDNNNNNNNNDISSLYFRTNLAVVYEF
jgi:hypothetical protein